MVVKVVDIDYHPDFLVTICGSVPFVFFLQFGCIFR